MFTLTMMLNGFQNIREGFLLTPVVIH